MHNRFVLTDEFIQNNKNNSFDNLIVIYGPFQLVNAIEAIKEFDLKKVLLIVIVNKIEKNNIQVENYIKKYDGMFSHIERLKFSENSRKYIEFMKFIYALKKNNFKNIAFATLGNIVKLLTTKLKYEQVILFDDGLETIHTAAYLHTRPRLVRPQYAYLGLNRYFKNKFICFSIFNHKNVKTIKNTMSVIDNNDKHQIDNNKLAFIGQDFVRTGYVDKKDYFDVLEFISSKYSDDIIEYYPHRGELDIELEEISKTFTNFKMMKIDSTFEVYLKSKNYLPKKVISCWSTVLVVMKEMFTNIEIESIMIDENKLLKNRDKILETYNYFLKEKVIVLDISGKEVLNA